MGPRNEDNGILLLCGVALVCGAIAFAAWLIAPTPAEANRARANQTEMAHNAKSVDAADIRVIVPFTLNTSPGQH